MNTPGEFTGGRRRRADLWADFENGPSGPETPRLFFADDRADLTKQTGNLLDGRKIEFPPPTTMDFGGEYGRFSFHHVTTKQSSEPKTWTLLTPNGV